MTAYVIADIEVTDQEAYREYAALVPGTLEPTGDGSSSAAAAARRSRAAGSRAAWS